MLETVPGRALVPSMEIASLQDGGFIGRESVRLRLRLFQAYVVIAIQDWGVAGSRLDTIRRLLGLADAELATTRPRLVARTTPLVRASQYLDAVEGELVRLAPDAVVEAALPSAVHNVRAQLDPTDDRRARLERAVEAGQRPTREVIVDALTAAYDARSATLAMAFTLRRLVAIATLLVTVLIVGTAVAGALWPDLLSLCAPYSVAVCPTGPEPGRADVAIVGLLGLAGGALGAALTLRAARGSPLPPGSLVVMALKLPLGALTAVTGLLLVAGRFAPGVGAFETSTEILAYALIFGYGQQLVSRSADQRIVEIGRRALDVVPALSGARMLDRPVPPTATPPRREPAPRKPRPARRRGAGLVARLRTAVVVGLAFGIAFVPLAVALGTWWAPAGVWAAAVLLAAALGPAVRPVRRLSWTAIAAAAAGSAYYAAIAALVWLGLRAAIAGMADLTRLVFGTAWSADGFAWWAAAAVGTVSSLTIAVGTAEDLARELVSDRAAVPSAYERLSARRRLYALCLPADVALAGATLLVDRVAPSAAAVAAVGAMITISVLSGWVAVAVIREERRRDPEHYQEAVAAALARTGFAVTERPRVGEPDVDGLLGQVDLVAERPGQTLAVQVVSSAPAPGKLTWGAASELLVASEALNRHAGPEASIQPAMVIIGLEADPSLLRLASRRGVRLVPLDPLVVEDRAALDDRLRVAVDPLTPPAVAP